MQAIGTYYSIEAQKAQAKSTASTLEYERSVAYFNARAAEDDAQQLLAAGRSERGRTGLRYRQLKASIRTRSAAAGIVGGVGSAAEVQASVEAANQIDQIQITRNAVRSSNQQRMRAVDLRGRGLLAGVSAANVRASAKTLNPWLGAATSLIGSGAQIAQTYATTERQNRYYSQKP